MYMHIFQPEQDCNAFGLSLQMGDAQPALYFRNVLLEAHTAEWESIQSDCDYFLANLLDKHHCK